MNETQVHLTFDSDSRGFRPGEILSGQYRLTDLHPVELEALEVSVLWYTEGKGDEDLAVHLFKRFSVADGELVDPLQPGRFSTQLPNSPLSYEGVIIKIRWVVRVRLFLARGREVVRDEPFELGCVESGRAVPP